MMITDTMHMRYWSLHHVRDAARQINEADVTYTLGALQLIQDTLLTY